MARAQAQYLRIYKDNITYNRWQSYYPSTNITWDGATWNYVPFEAAGFTSGQSADEGEMSILVPATALCVDAVLSGINEARLCELRLYMFDPDNGNDAPQAAQILITTYVGEIVMASGSLTQLEMKLGSSLSPVGAQVPPLKLSTQLIGVPAIMSS